jgi:deazaflavin-dependent oxidoreductase (nitroreductase family)
MAKTSQAPLFVRLTNVLTTNLLRAGFKLGGYKYPMCLFTVRERKSGQPHTIPIVIVEHDRKRSLVSTFGVVDWVCNLRARGVAILTRGRRHEEVRARELPGDEASLVLKEFLTRGKTPPIVGSFGATADASREDFERAAASHPVVVVERK